MWCRPDGAGCRSSAEAPSGNTPSDPNVQTPWVRTGHPGLRSWARLPDRAFGRRAKSLAARAERPVVPASLMWRRTFCRPATGSGPTTRWRCVWPAASRSPISIDPAADEYRGGAQGPSGAPTRKTHPNDGAAGPAPAVELVVWRLDRLSRLTSHLAPRARPVRCPAPRRPRRPHRQRRRRSGQTCRRTQQQPPPLLPRILRIAIEVVPPLAAPRLPCSAPLRRSRRVHRYLPGLLASGSSCSR